MNYNYMIIYQKENGKMMYRAIKHKPTYKVGDITSMGWKVLDIKRLLDGKCYSRFEFNNKLRHKKKLVDILTLIDKDTVYKAIMLLLLALLYILK